MFEFMIIQRNLRYVLYSSKIQQGVNSNNALEISKKVLFAARGNYFRYENESRQIVFFMPRRSNTGPSNSLPFFKNNFSHKTSKRSLESLIESFAGAKESLFCHFYTNSECFQLALSPAFEIRPPFNARRKPSTY